MSLWGYERSSLFKCVIFQSYDVLCSCSVAESVSQGRWLYSVLCWVGSVAVAFLFPEPEWRWFTLLQQIRLAGLQCWHCLVSERDSVYTAKWLGNKSKKISGFGFFFSSRNISPKGFFCCWAQLLYKVTEMQSLQEHNHVAWKIKWDSFFLGIQHTAWCHYCSVSSGVPKT